MSNSKCITQLVLVVWVSLQVACTAEQAQRPAVKPGTIGKDAATRVEISPAAHTAAHTIDVAQLKRDIEVLASDEFGGRGPGTDNDRKTQRYLVDRLRELGFQPGGAGGSEDSELDRWLQPFRLVSIDTQQPAVWRIGRESFVQGSEFIVASGTEKAQVKVEAAELVFVGYGIQAPEYAWDDFKTADLRGKILVMLNNDPDWDPALFAGEKRLYYGRWVYKYESAARQGAAGAIIIHTEKSAGYPWQVVQTSWTGPQFSLPSEGEPELQLAGWLTQRASERLLQSTGHSLAELIDAAAQRSFEPVSLGVTSSIVFSNQVSQTSSANVVGLLPRSGGVNAHEWVVYTAHHDHLGTAAPVVDEAADIDRIYNGALDNASGVAMVLAIAGAHQRLAQPSGRSIMVALVGAEEQGLLGSAYFARNPPVPTNKMAAVFNYDGANIFGPTRDLTYVGYGKSTLDAIAHQVAALQQRELKPDQSPDKGYFYRSDQFSLAKVGVPAMFLRNGLDVVGRPAGWGREQQDRYTKVNYHQPSDELTGNWRFDGMVQDAQLGFYAGWLVANAEDMPVWYAGDEFEAARLRSLAP